MTRRLHFSLRRLLLVVALFGAAVELGNLSLASWGPCGRAGAELKMETAIAGCTVSYFTLVFCAIALSPRPRTTADFLMVAIVVLAISLVATLAFLAKLVHDTHGRRTIIFTPPMKSD